eukprot:5078677-Pyramimonas_sp.AAC.1
MSVSIQTESDIKTHGPVIMKLHESPADLIALSFAKPPKLAVEVRAGPSNAPPIPDVAPDCAHGLRLVAEKAYREPSGAWSFLVMARMACILGSRGSRLRTWIARSRRNIAPTCSRSAGCLGSQGLHIRLVRQMRYAYPWGRHLDPPRESVWPPRGVRAALLPGCSSLAGCLLGAGPGPAGGRKYLGAARGRVSENCRRGPAVVFQVVGGPGLTAYRKERGERASGRGSANPG